MAKLELTLPYQLQSDRERTLFSAFWIILGLALTWAILHAGPFLNLLGITSSLWQIVAQIVVLFVAGVAYIYVPYQIATNDVEGVNVIANKDGLGLPSTSYWGITAPRWLLWEEVRTLEMQHGLDGNSYVRIGLKDGDSCHVKCNSLKSEDLEQLLLAIEVWAEKAVWSTRLSEFRDTLSNVNRGLTGLSYTQLWEEELGRRFNATTFVPLEPGHKLRSGTIKIVRQLAFGGFSAVYLAADDRAGTVVLKESVFATDDQDPAQKKALELFQREAILLAKLQHPQIVRIIDHFVEALRDYLVIEYLEGENLRQLVRRLGRQPESKVIPWAKQMASILLYLHSQNPPIVHRDFTPDNLILKNDDRLVLIDFGAANQFLGSATGTLLGKPAYMAAEQVKGKATPASDLYALGCIVYFLLVGHDPETLAVASPDWQGCEISPALKGLIVKLTSMEADRRPGAGELLSELEQILPSSKALPTLPSKPSY